MTAKEMFEKLGYKLIQNDIYKIVYQDNWLDDGSHIRIEFDLQFKHFNPIFTNKPYLKTDTFMDIDVPLFLAITQQMKELGWIE